MSPLPLTLTRPSSYNMESSTASLASSYSDSYAGTPNTSLYSKGKSSRPYKFSTLCVTMFGVSVMFESCTQSVDSDNPDANHRDQWGSSAVPIYQTATFKGMGGQYDYSRSGNPTRKFLEHHIAKISSARHAFAVSSGMGALDIIFRLLKPGDEIIAGNDLYGGSNRLITYLKEHSNITTHHISTTNPDNFLPLLTKPDSKVKMVLLETPTNPLLQIADISAISELVHIHIPEAIIVVDNTMMSPYLQKPLEHGADIVYDSATKYLSGHHDLMAGLIVCDRDDIAKGIAHVINSVGNGLAPNDCFLLLRGTKTLAIRMDAQQQSALAVAHYLDDLGFKVHFPGLASHPGKQVHDRHARGAGAVLSFVTDDKALSERIVGAARLWGISVSFGCVNSLISMPCLMSHASIDPAVRKERNLPEDLIRLCVGIEDTEDLIDDLEAALLEAGAIRITEDADGQRVVERVTSPLEADSVPLENAKDSPAPTEIVTSAPGKVILFGEHAVVHGATAIAGALDLRCYCSVSPRFDNKVSLVLPDIQYEASWDIETLPDQTTFAFDSAWKPENSPASDLIQQLETLVKGADKEVANHAAIGFLYLYVRLAKEQHRLAQTFVVRSTLPIGAGLGSSAAYSVSISSALLYTHGHLSSAQAPSASDAQLVNSWAFVAEKVNHGQPSGVDDAVSTHGGALSFRKGSGFQALHGFDSLRFLLTNTKVPRNTRTLVAGVAELKSQHPAQIDSVLQAIDTISERAKTVLSDTALARADQIKALEGLIEENSRHLDTLQVSHPSLSVIRSKTAKAPYHLSTKLTGAGGGGCAVTLIPDDYDNKLLEDLEQDLLADGFECYKTKVGGNGFAFALGHSFNGRLFTDTPTKALAGLLDGLSWK